jgi:hypothetical protein
MATPLQPATLTSSSLLAGPAAFLARCPLTQRMLGQACWDQNHGESCSNPRCQCLCHEGVSR